MNILKKLIGYFPLGIWIALIAIIFSFLAWGMQIYSLLDWEGAIKLGIQKESFAGSEVERALANVERGIALADIIWPLPIAIIAFIGLLRKNFIGFITAMMVFAICVYFPLIYIFRSGAGSDIILGVIFLWLIPSLLGIIGLWTNKNIFWREVYD